MTEMVAVAFRTVGHSATIPDGLVVPFYLEDRKLRVSVARVANRLYAFDDLCRCAERPCPLSGGLLTGFTLMCQCMAPASTSPPGRSSAARRRTRWRSTRSKKSTVMSRSAHERPSTGRRGVHRRSVTLPPGPAVAIASGSQATVTIENAIAEAVQSFATAEPRELSNTEQALMTLIAAGAMAKARASGASPDEATVCAVLVYLSLWAVTRRLPRTPFS
jgi:hypothetical protein